MDAKIKFQRRLSLVVLVLVLVLGTFFALTQFITDFMWFSEMGYLYVFLKQIVTMVKVGVPAFIVTTLLLQLYLGHLRKSYFAHIASKEEPNMKKLKLATIGFSVVAGLMATVVTVSQLWFEILKFAASTDFDIKDPLFSLDISFYIFKLDFLTQLNEILLLIVVGFVVLTVIYYIFLMTVRTPDVFKDTAPFGQNPTGTASDEERHTGSENPFGGNAGVNSPDDFLGALFKSFGFQQAKKVHKETKPRRQFDDNNFKELMKIASGKITLLGIIFFLMLGIDFFLMQFELLHEHTGVVYGAGFVDVNITLWMYRILCVLSLVAGASFAINMMKKKYKRIFIVPVLMVVVGLLGGGAGYLIQTFVVSSDEIRMEGEYLKRNIEYTQYAYGIDDVKVKPFAADNTLTADLIAQNSETINNIRVNDFEPAKQFYNQTQSIRRYYTFNDVDNDRYMINGKYTQTFMTAREIDEDKINDTWLNKHLKYTHGYGVALSRVDKVTSSGQPDVLIGNIPPASKVSEIEITRPEIYFGELGNEYIVVGAKEDEFDYPDGTENAYSRYEGKAGIKLNLLNRALFAIREGSMKLLISSNINSDSRIIINRNITKRVQTIMPYLNYERDPYMVTVDGKLYWMLDAYTTSGNYPYSEPYEEGVNYIRNSVKVVIDAYNGDTNFYIVDEKDPVAKTMAKIYPTLFKGFKEMPEGLKSHLRYPNTLFGIQAGVYGKYHMEDINVFYQDEDHWDIASEIYGMEKSQIKPSYYIAKLPGEEKAEFFNSVPFTPKQKQNMTALMVARNDGNDYGDLVLYQFPKSRNIYGPEQIEAQINQSTEISKEFALWDSSGTKYRRGNLFVIPIESSVLYVEPVYLEAQNSSIPEVKRVIMAYDDQIAYKETLGECIKELFGDNKGQGSEPNSDLGEEPEDKDLTKSEVAKAASEAYEKALKYQKAGDWAKYGEYIEKVGNYLTDLAKE